MVNFFSFFQILVNDRGDDGPPETDVGHVGHRLPDLNHPHLRRGRADRQLPVHRCGPLRLRSIVALRIGRGLDCRTHGRRGKNYFTVFTLQ